MKIFFDLNYIFLFIVFILFFLLIISLCFKWSKIF